MISFELEGDGLIVPAEAVLMTPLSCASILIEHDASVEVDVLVVTLGPLGDLKLHIKEALEVSQAITWAIESDDSPFKGKVDETKIAVSGHSKGGKISFYTAAIDPRVDLVIAWDPQNAGGAPCFIAEPIPGMECNALPVAPNCWEKQPGILHYMNAESLTLGMPRDTAVTPERHHNAIHFYRGAPSPAMFVQFNTGHVAPLTNSRVIELNKAVHMSLLLSRFYGMYGTDLDKWLPDTPGGKANLELKDVIIRAESK